MTIPTFNLISDWEVLIITPKICQLGGWKDDWMGGGGEVNPNSTVNG